MTESTTLALLASIASRIPETEREDAIRAVRDAEYHGEPVRIQSPEDAVGLLSPWACLEQEHLIVILLNTRNEVVKVCELYRGSLNSSHIRIGEVFREAVRDNCASIIIAHNHPSGDTTPSPEDVSVTRAIIDAGKLLDIEVLDHVVIGSRGYVSLKARGLAFN